MSRDEERYFSKRSDAETKLDVAVAIAVPAATGTPALRSQLLPTAVPHYYMVSSLGEAWFFARNFSCRHGWSCTFAEYLRLFGVSNVQKPWRELLTSAATAMAI
jgi:hypothetical protein